MNETLLQQLQDFMRLAGGFRASRVILTANNYEVFEHVKTPTSAAALARKIKTDPRATEILLDAVTALGLLAKRGTRYRNTATATQFLVRESRWYQGDMLRHSDTLWKNWSGLDDVVKTGMPNRAGARHHESFIRAMHNNAVFRAPNVLRAVDLKGVKRAIDLGGGPGTYTIELARKGIGVTLFDLPNTVAIAKKIVKESNVRGVDFIAGDFHVDEFGKGYDLAFLSQILHSLSRDESLALLKKARAALNPKGQVAIHEFFLAEDRAHPVPGAMFSINMLVNTAAGRCYTPKEMKTWLVRAGFKNVRTKMLGDTVVVTGRRS